MFDMKYYTLLKAISDNDELLSNYTDLRGIRSKDDYSRLWEDLMYKYNIDVAQYSEIRKYLVLSEAYFKDYNLIYLKRKVKQFEMNGHH
jgi:hypothetical protein